MQSTPCFLQRHVVLITPRRVFHRYRVGNDLFASPPVILFTVTCDGGVCVCVADTVCRGTLPDCTGSCRHHRPGVAVWDTYGAHW